MRWRWLIAGLLAGYVWGLGTRADRAREAGREEGVRAGWEACASMFPSSGLAGRRSGGGAP